MTATSWRIRHQGSPRSIEGLTLPQVVEGLQEGLWETTDEVMGPQDPQWLAIDNHPQLAEIAADVEPPPPKEYDDETRLDMNPLIDVALVLLIFFILTTSYTALQKVLQMPDFTSKDVKGAIRQVPEAEVKKLMIRVRAQEENGQPVFYVEDHKGVDLNGLAAELSQYVRQSQKTQLLIDARGIDWGTVVEIQDIAKAAGIERSNFLKKPTASPPSGRSPP